MSLFLLPVPKLICNLMMLMSFSVPSGLLSCSVSGAATSQNHHEETNSTVSGRFTYIIF